LLFLVLTIVATAAVLVANGTRSSASGPATATTHVPLGPGATRVTVPVATAATLPDPPQPTITTGPLPPAPGSGTTAAGTFTAAALSTAHAKGFPDAYQTRVTR